MTKVNHLVHIKYLITIVTNVNAYVWIVILCRMTKRKDEVYFLFAKVKLQEINLSLAWEVNWIKTEWLV